MKIRDFLREHKLSVGDNMILLFEKLGIEDKELIRKLETEIGESAKMSKSKGNVVDPEEAIERYGADTVRLYILFAAPPEQDFEWTEEGIQGAYRFLNRLWNFVVEKEEELRETTYTKVELGAVQGRAKEIRRLVHQTIKDYRTDMERRLQLNTAIAKLMKLFNELSSFEVRSEVDRKVLKEAVEILLLLLSPIAPHICEELWHRIGKKTLIVKEHFPEADEEALRVEEIEIPVQINGKLRARVKIPFGAEEEVVRRIVLENDRVKDYLDGGRIRKFIYVRNKLVNIVLEG